uniref:DbpA domain-containing protein n=2 Tax=cellular organisms TaxID=131567 RepID=T1HJI0_RHOPR
MQLYRIEVGRDDGVQVRHIVGAIAIEGDISSRYIGNIKLFASHSTIELPKGMPGDLLTHFTRTRILNKPMNMQLIGDAQPFERRERSDSRGAPRSGASDRRDGGRRSFGGQGDARREGQGERRDRNFNRDGQRSEGQRAPRRRPADIGQ